VEERTWHTDVDLRDGAKSGTGDGWRPFYGGPVARQRERVGGLARCRVEGKNGKGRGGPGCDVGQRGGTAMASNGLVVTRAVRQWPCRAAGRTGEGPGG
jgi:hypothetical protein